MPYHSLMHQKCVHVFLHEFLLVFLLLLFGRRPQIGYHDQENDFLTRTHCGAHRHWFLLWRNYGVIVRLVSEKCERPFERGTVYTQSHIYSCIPFYTEFLKNGRIGLKVEDTCLQNFSFKIVYA